MKAQIFPKTSLACKNYTNWRKFMDFLKIQLSTGIVTFHNSKSDQW